ncbi:hypothetical protein CR513_23714, partial [Mucuna pruriens]
MEKVKLQSLCRQYELLSMNDQESIGDYLTKIQMLVNSIKTCGEKLLDKQIVDKILRTLTPQFYHIVVAIEGSKDLQRMRAGSCKIPLKLMNKGFLREAAHAFRRNDGGTAKTRRENGRTN